GGDDSEPRGERRHALHGLEVHGQEHHPREQGEAGDHAVGGAEGEQPQLEQHHGYHGFGGPPFHQHQHHAQHEGHGHQSERQRVGPPALAPGPGQVEQQRGGGGDDQGGAEVVHGAAAALGGDAAQGRGGDDEGEQAQRHVDQEDPPPADRVDEAAADEGAGEGGDAEHHGDHALVAAPVPDRDHVGDHRQGERVQRSGAEALHRAGGDQLGDLLGHAAQRRAHDEDAGRHDEDDAAPELVGDLAPDGGARHRGQQVGGDHPGQVLQAAHVADDAGQGRAHHGLV